MAKRQSPYTGDVAEAFADALHELPEQWVMCRDMMHAWSVEHDFYVVDNASTRKNKVQHIGRTLICMRCEAERRERYIVTRNGLEKLSQSYFYPEGYQIHGVPRGKKPKALVQQEAYRRSMEKVAKLHRATG